MTQSKYSKFSSFIPHGAITDHQIITTLKTTLSSGLTCFNGLLIHCIFNFCFAFSLRFMQCPYSCLLVAAYHTNCPLQSTGLYIFSVCTCILKTELLLFRIIALVLLKTFQKQKTQRMNGEFSLVLDPNIIKPISFTDISKPTMPGAGIQRVSTIESLSSSNSVIDIMI